ncbi:hypothetical protein N1851_015794 [Merluccius polli]|uniref:Alkylated DNA repair protein AlkB homologue 8 N-terminal domain-containing protein n=1 Tax=Merluccius polli TaxID=89951 RepID=A0AA47MRS5_MERPO|nr:hypothetical protein N1851_015794 [Merluccius polli]
MAKKAHQRLYLLRRLRKFGMNGSILINFYRCTTESLLKGYITGLVRELFCPQLQTTIQRVVEVAAQHITGNKLPAIQDVFHQRCLRKAHSIAKDHMLRISSTYHHPNTNTSIKALSAGSSRGRG